MSAYLVAIGLVCWSLTAQAQKAADFRQFPDVIFELVPGQEQVGLYSSLADTLKPRPSLRLSRPHSVAVIGEYSPQWAVMQVSGFSYFIRQRELLGLRPSQRVGQAAAHIQAPLPLNDLHRIDFAQVVDVPGASQSELYARGKVWFASQFQSTLNATQADDKQAGILIGRAWRPTYVPTPNGGVFATKVWYTVKLAFKDGRYRYSLTDFQFSDYGGLSGYAPEQAEGLAFATRGNGSPTNQARYFTRALSQEAYFLRAALELGMSRPASGTDF